MYWSIIFFKVVSTLLYSLIPESFLDFGIIQSTSLPHMQENLLIYFLLRIPLYM